MPLLPRGECDIETQHAVLVAWRRRGAAHLENHPAIQPRQTLAALMTEGVLRVIVEPEVPAAGRPAGPAARDRSVLPALVFHLVLVGEVGVALDRELEARGSLREVREIHVLMQAFADHS